MKNQNYTAEFFYFSYGFAYFGGKAFWGLSAGRRSAVLV